MVSGWRDQQASRNLNAATLADRESALRRFQRFTGEYPWTWRPQDLEEFTAELRGGDHPAALSTIHGYQCALRLFLEYVSDPPAICGAWGTGWATPPAGTRLPTPSFPEPTRILRRHALTPLAGANEPCCSQSASLPICLASATGHLPFGEGPSALLATRSALVLEGVLAPMMSHQIGAANRTCVTPPSTVIQGRISPRRRR